MKVAQIRLFQRILPTRALLLFLLCSLTSASVTAKDLVYYLVDKSGSMDTKELVEPVKDSIYQHASSLGTDTDVYLRFFNGRASELMFWSGFDPNKQANFRSTVESEFKAIGRTRLFDTVAEAVAQIRSVATRYERVTFIIFSDGDDTASSDNSRTQRWSLITPDVLKLGEVNPFARTYFIALPGQNPTKEDLEEFKKSGIIYSSVPKEAIVIPEESPKISFTASPTKAEPSEEIRFKPSNAGGKVERYVWSFGDGSQKESSGAITHSYYNEGSYTVRLEAKGPGGEDATERQAYIQIAYNVPLEAGVSIFPEKPIAGQSIQFTSTSTGNPERLEWVLNGQVVATKSPYLWEQPSAGQHTIELRIYKDARSDDTTSSFEVAPPPPSSKFSFPEGDEYDYGATIKAVAAASGPGLKHTWTVDGDERLSGQAIEWKATRDGLIEFTHSVEDAYGNISFASDKVLVREPVVELPSAGFSIEPLEALVQEPVRLTATANDPGLSHEWYLNDKRIGSAPSVQFTPEKEGAVAIRHVIRRGEVSKENASDLFVGKPELAIAQFKVSDDSGKLPHEVRFKDKSEGKIVAYRWDFGDGGSSDLKEPTYIFERAGEWKVRLTVTNAAGEQTASTEEVIITVKEPMPAWVKWAVLGAIAAIILLLLWMKLKPSVIDGSRLKYSFEGKSKTVDLEGTKFEFSSLSISGWKPKSVYVIVNKDGDKLLRDGAVIEDLGMGRRKQFKLEGAEFTYLP